MIELKDWLSSINIKKNNLLKEDSSAIKDYPPFVINRCLSAHVDSILFANEMNLNSHLPKDIQYQFYLNTLGKKNRYAPWLKKSKVEYLEYVKQYYGYSDEKALQVLKILNKEQLTFIKNKFTIGGMKNESKY